METVMLRMVSTVRRRFRSEFLKMRRRIFIGLLRAGESASRLPDAQAIPGGNRRQCGKGLKRIARQRVSYHENRVWELGWKVFEVEARNLS
jgi:hypothetical protein